MRQYQKEMEQVIAQTVPRDAPPRLLLHSCCAPCSSAVLLRLVPHFSVTVFYENPNIFPPEEYQKRLEEQKRLLLEMPEAHGVSLIAGDYDPERFLCAVRGLEQEPEGGERCRVCFRMRLDATAKVAAEQGFAFFGTTLSISPHKNAEQINQAGEAAAEAEKIRWLPADFKKKNGYQQSLLLSKKYKLYRQDYCGCPFARRDAETD